MKRVIRLLVPVVIGCAVVSGCQTAPTAKRKAVVFDEPIRVDGSMLNASGATTAQTAGSGENVGDFIVYSIGDQRVSGEPYALDAGEHCLWGGTKDTTIVGERKKFQSTLGVSMRFSLPVAGKYKLLTQGATVASLADRTIGQLPTKRWQATLRNTETLASIPVTVTHDDASCLSDAALNNGVEKGSFGKNVRGATSFFYELTFRAMMLAVFGVSY